jgi:hypothetical protein
MMGGALCHTSSDEGLSWFVDSFQQPPWSPAPALNDNSGFYSVTVIKQ